MNTQILLFGHKSYRWIVVAACFLMVFVTLGFCSGTKSLYLVAITEATGIRRSLFSISDSCRFITTAVVNLFFGSLIARFGARKMIGAGFLSLIAFSLIYAHADNIYAFYLGGCLLGAGLSWTTTTMVGHLVNAWCKEHRGTIMGLVLAANGLGGAAATQILSPIINSGRDVYGYRSAYYLTAVLLAAAAVIVLVFVREPSGDTPQAVVSKKKARGGLWPGISAEQAMKTPYLYAAAAGVFATGMTLQGINGVAVAHMKDVGLDADYIAAIFSFYSLALAGCKLLVGAMYDKLGLRRTILICDAAAVVSIFLLASVAPTPGGKALAVLYGALSALAMPLETIMLPLIVSDLFGEHSYEKLLGIFVSVNTAGYALGTPLTNLCYDRLGTYTPALIVLCGIMACVTVAFIFVLNAADRKRRELIPEQTA